MFGLPYIIAPMEVQGPLFKFSTMWVCNTPSCNCVMPHCDCIVVRTSPGSFGNLKPASHGHLAWHTSHGWQMLPPF